MSKKPHWTSDQIKSSGLIETDKYFIKSEKLVDKKPKKLPSLIDRSIPDKLMNNVKKLSERYKDNPFFNPSTTKSNSRVKNATKIEAYGIVFDSKLEAYMYGLLENAGIEFEHQNVFVVQNKFNYNGEAVRAIKCVVDFWLPKQFMIIDSKGFSTDVSKLKYKLLKNHLHNLNIYPNDYECPKIEMPKNKSECDILMLKLKFEL